MKRTSVFVASGLALAVFGCVLGSMQSMSAIDMQCTVVSAAGHRPIEGARVAVEFDPANPDSPPLAPIVFVTDATGRCRVVVPKQTKWISGSDAFVGGYLRRISVSAAEFEGAGVSEGFEKGSLGDIRERTFELHPLNQPNQALEPTTNGCHVSCCGGAAPTIVVAHL